MKHKYVISKSDDKKRLMIREYSELDKEMFSLLCEQAYDSDVIASAISMGKKALISALRTENMYPIGIFAGKIADSVIDIYASEIDQPVEIFFNDIDILSKDRKVIKIEEDVKKETAGIAELLDEEDSVPGYENDDDEISQLTSSIKMVDDDAVDMEDEN